VTGKCCATAQSRCCTCPGCCCWSRPLTTLSDSTRRTSTMQSRFWRTAIHDLDYRTITFRSWLEVAYIYTLWWISDEMTENKWHAKKAASPSAVVTVSERAVNGVWSISNFRQPLCSQQLDIAENPGKRICPEFRVTRWVHDAIVYSYMQLQLYVVRVIMVAL